MCIRDRHGAAAMVCANWGEDGKTEQDYICGRGLKSVWGNPTPETWKDIPQTVSYTHLDVYKRQVPRRRGPAGLRDPIAVSLTALIGFTVLVDRDYRVRKKAHFVFMRRAVLPALPAPSAALLYALMH